MFYIYYFIATTLLFMSAILCSYRYDGEIDIKGIIFLLVLSYTPFINIAVMIRVFVDFIEWLFNGEDIVLFKRKDKQ